MPDPRPPLSPEPPGAAREKTSEEKLKEIVEMPPLTPEQIEANPTEAARAFLSREWHANTLQRDTVREKYQDSWQERADGMQVAILNPTAVGLTLAFDQFQVAKNSEWQKLQKLKEKEEKDLNDFDKQDIRRLEAELAPYGVERTLLLKKLGDGKIDFSHDFLPPDKKESFQKEWLADERMQLVQAETKRGVKEEKIEAARARYEKARVEILGTDLVKIAAEEEERKKLEEILKAKKGVLQKGIESGIEKIKSLRKEKKERKTAPAVPDHLAPFERAKEAGLLLSPELIERNPKEAVRTYLTREYECVAKLIRERIEKGEDTADLEAYARKVREGLLRPTADVLDIAGTAPFLVREGAKQESALKAKVSELSDEKEFQRLSILSTRTPEEVAEMERRDTLVRATPEFQNLESFRRALDEFDKQGVELFDKGISLDFAALTTAEEREAFLKSALEVERNFVVELENKAEKKPGREVDAALAKTTERYAEIRAEFIANDIAKFVGEETELLKRRAEIVGEGWFEKVRYGWKKLGEINLNKVWKPDNWKNQWAGRLINARTGISGALALGGLAVPGWGLGFVALRSVMGGLGAGFGAYELLRTRYEAKNMHLTDEEVKKLSDTEVERRLLHLAAYAKMNGSWQAIQPTYDRLAKKYHEDLAKKMVEGTLDERLGSGTAEYIAKTREEQVKLGKEEWSKEKKRRGAAAGVGVLGALGIHGLRAWWESGAGALTRKLFPDLYAEAPTVNEPDYWRTARARGRPLVPMGEDHGMGPVGEAGVSGRAPDTIPGPRAGETLGESAPDVGPGRISTPESLRSEYEIPFKYGEGPIHQARKAIALFSANNEAAWGRLTPEQKIWAETQLWLRTAKELGLELRPDMQPKQGFFKIGESLKFKSDTINSILEETQSRFGSGEGAKAIKRNLRQYVGNVNWDRYQVVNGQGKWELPTDQGVRIRARISKKDLTGDTDLGTIRWNIKAETILGSEPQEGGIQTTEKEVQVVLRDRNWAPPAPPGEFTPSPVPEFTPSPDMTPAPEAPTGEGGVAITLEETPEIPKGFNEAVMQNVVEQVSGLSPKFYDLVKDMPVSGVLKKRLIPFIEEQRWPWPRNISPNHVDSMRYIKLRDKIKTTLSLLSEADRVVARKMPVSEFIRRHLAVFLPK